MDISDENYEGHGEHFRDEMEESSPTDVRLLFTDGKDPTGDGLYPAVTSEGLVFLTAARETLGQNVETNDLYVVDVPHLGISDSNEKQLCMSWRATW